MAETITITLTEANEETITVTLDQNSGTTFVTGGGITVGTTIITGGTTTRILYNNAGVVGEYGISGTGSVAMTASPTFTGTVTVSGDLTVDTDSLHVDSTNNRVGIGTTTPTEELDVVGTIRASANMYCSNLIASSTGSGMNFREGVTALGTVVSSMTISISAGSVVTAKLTASTACTFTMPNAGSGQNFILHLKQASTTGNGTATFTNVIWSGGTAPVVTATAGKMDIFSFVVGPDAAGTGYKWYGSAIQNLTPT